MAARGGVPAGRALPQEIAEALDHVMDVVMRVPVSPGLMPDRARVRYLCALTLLMLGDETGDLMRRRAWQYRGGVWVFRQDLVDASHRVGLQPAAADALMGLPHGQFERWMSERACPSLSENSGSGEEQACGLVSYHTVAEWVRASE